MQTTSPGVEALGVRAMVRRTVRASVALGLVSLAIQAGCASTPPTPAQAAAERVEMNFDISQCQELEPNLYRCPSIDKPLCNPDFARADVDCVRITKTGHVIVLHWNN
jgi:hypothetical protein